MPNRAEAVNSRASDVAGPIWLASGNSRSGTAPDVSAVAHDRDEGIESQLPGVVAVEPPMTGFLNRR
jgi:hypothetical protein